MKLTDRYSTITNDELMLQHPSNSVYVRRAKSSDLDAIVGIWLEGQYIALENKITDIEVISHYFFAKLNAQCDVFGIWVAEHDRCIVGWQGLQPCRNNPVYVNTVAESSTYILHSSRGRGIGVMLLDFAQRHAARVGLKQLRGHVSISNSSSLKLVEKMGWSRVGTFPIASEDEPNFYLYAYAIRTSQE